MHADYFKTRYELIELIGEGGEGKIWKAYDHAVDRTVAIKELSLKTKAREEALNEARVIARLNHPNIVSLYDIIEEDNKIYLVIEYVEGVTLRDILEEIGPLPFEAALGIFLQVASAIELAHSHGILHLDIKPENIMILPNGKVKIGDFGVSQFILEQKPSDAVKGTAHYLAPESLKGRYSERTDVFSLGVVLYEMLSGENPFFSITIHESFQRLSSYIPEPVTEYREDIPVDFGSVLSKALEKSPPKRYTNIIKFRIKVERFVDFQEPQEPVSHLFEQEKPRIKVRKLSAKTRFIVSRLGAFLSVFLFTTLAVYAIASDFSASTLLAVLIISAIAIFSPSLSGLLGMTAIGIFMISQNIFGSILIILLGIAAFFIIRDISNYGVYALFIIPSAILGLEPLVASIGGAKAKLKELISFGSMLLISSAVFYITKPVYSERFLVSLKNYSVGEVALPLFSTVKSGEFTGLADFMPLGVELLFVVLVLLASWTLSRIFFRTVFFSTLISLLVALSASLAMGLINFPTANFEIKASISIFMILVYKLITSFTKASLMNSERT